MDLEQAKYRKLTKYKYQLVHELSETIDLKPEEEFRTPYVELNTDGLISIRKKCACDASIWSSTAP